MILTNQKKLHWMLSLEDIIFCLFQIIYKILTNLNVLLHPDHDQGGNLQKEKSFGHFQFHAGKEIIGKEIISIMISTLMLLSMIGLSSMINYQKV